jgi:hypothetical protein
MCVLSYFLGEPSTLRPLGPPQVLGACWGAAKPGCCLANFDAVQAARRAR